MKTQIIAVLAMLACACQDQSKQTLQSTAAAPALPAGFVAAAEAEFGRSHTTLCPAPATSEFKANYNFPATVPADFETPWDAFDFKTKPEEFLRAILNSAVDANDAADWATGTTETGWYHAPWMHEKREPYHGMTLERGARKFNLHENQKDRRENWAVGFYNIPGATAFQKAWADKASPKTTDFVFPVGSASVKLLFTEATATEVPYLVNSKTWKTCIFNARGQPPRVVDMHLLQVDVAVKVGAAAGPTEWVYGTFIYWNTDKTKPFSWDLLKPAALQWGNDPALTFDTFSKGHKPQESWTNPTLDAEFARIRATPDAEEVDNQGVRLLSLGLFGRANGPVDNPLSACLACHGRAADAGQSVTAGQLRAALPMLVTSIRDDTQIARQFRNLRPDEPFAAGWEALDYSLQAAEGVSAFRTWVRLTYPEQDCKTTDVTQFPYPCPTTPPGPAIASAEERALPRQTSEATRLTLAQHSAFARDEEMEAEGLPQ